MFSNHKNYSVLVSQTVPLNPVFETCLDSQKRRNCPKTNT